MRCASERDGVGILVYLPFRVDYELRTKITSRVLFTPTPRYANEISRVYATVYLFPKSHPATLMHLLQSPNQIPSYIPINNATNPKSWHDPPHPRHRTHAPVPRHSGEPLLKPQPTLSIE